MYNGFKTGGGAVVPTLANGALNLNALMNTMVSRDIWTYYYTLKLAPSQTFLQNGYNLFNAAVGDVDPYPYTSQPTGSVLTMGQTNMPSKCSSGFSAPQDLILDSIGFYIAPFCGAVKPTGAPLLIDIEAFTSDVWYEFKIIDKQFSQGRIEFQPAGIGMAGTSNVQGEAFWTNGYPLFEARLRMGKFAKYLAPLMRWSLNIYFGGATLPQMSSQGNGIALVSLLTGLTDRAVQ
jgi:hypothetical protein